ncbi:UNVERIFIED_CONTAM: Transposon Ty3-G Gag-Pol polyprotein [Sesamum calycinum]|uniref:Transposon Ty3-G Gag-Pol polyprotein n=1 Tax=Sesamum calycinum TaxID=2727403 RepID=A0AAW2L9V0_9LAMI
MTVNVAPFKLKNTTKNSGAPKNNVPYERPQRKLSLKEMQVREYPFLDSDVSGIFDDLLEAKLIDLLEMKQPEEAKQKDDLRYCKYHHLIGHAIQDCFVFKDKVMQLARQGKISLEEDSTATNAITTDSGHVDDNKDFHVTPYIGIISQEMRIHYPERRIPLMLMIACLQLLSRTKIYFLGLNLIIVLYSLLDIDKKPFTKVESHFVDAKYYIEDANKGKEINLKQLSKPPLKGFVHSTQEDEGIHEALTIDKKGFDPKAFKLLIKAGYNPKEKPSLGKLPLEATGKKLRELNATQMMLKEKGHAIQDSRVDGEFEEKDAEYALVELEEGEMNKLIEFDFIREVKYPMWISSIVLVRKKNGQIRVCIDFRVLNNACPKYDFPLPIAELMIDATTGHEALSFMDGSSGYNKIRMAPADEELTAFHTPKGLDVVEPMTNSSEKLVAKSKHDWHERIGEALWAYRTTVRTPTQATPCALVYGVEVVIPLEQQIPSLWIAMQEGLIEEENA